jgi:hypothetical protein
MRFIRAHSQSRQRCWPDGPAQTVPPAVDTVSEAPLTRFEGDTSTAGRISAMDPYAAWVQQRAQERGAQQQPEIRWVYRHPAQARPGGARETSAGTQEGLLGTL